jgi:hypothetical protein
MMHIGLYREGGRYVESADIKKGKRKKRRKGVNTIDDEQPSTLGVQESIEVITKHSTEGIHQWPLWLQDRHGRLL